jgi:tRNA threonylcarbamoyladenosine biosynthesis protein TsaE
MDNTVVTSGEAETIALGRKFSVNLKSGDVVALYGELGSGKTQFVKGVCAGLGATEHVTSPTFTLINEYRQHPGIPVFHLDLYRIRSFEELCALGVEEYLDDAGVSLIEWAEKAESILPRKRFTVTFRVIEGIDRREIHLERSTG